MEKDTTKITIEIPLDLYNRLNKAVPWGLRKHLIASVLGTIVDAIESDGQIVTGAVMAGQFKLTWEPPGQSPKEAA